MNKCVIHLRIPRILFTDYTSVFEAFQRGSAAGVAMAIEIDLVPGEIETDNDNIGQGPVGIAENHIESNATATSAAMDAAGDTPASSSTPNL